MATGHDKVNCSRITCSVCLESYRGREHKILPCFHTFCVPCLAGLVTKRDFTQVSDTPALDTDEEEGRSADTVTCPTCRRVIPVPAGGVTAFQTNFYLDSSSMEEESQPVPCTLCDGDQTAQFHCGHCQNDLCPQCQRYHDRLCREGQVRVLQDPSDSSSSSSSTAQSPSHRQVRQQLQKVEDALKKLTEEERKLNQERRAVDDSINLRYTTLLRLAADARDTCCLSLREVYDGLTDRLHSSMAEARQTRDTLQQQLSSSQPVPVSASQLRAALFMEEELPMILDRDLGSSSLLQHHTGDITSLMTDAVQSFVRKTVRAGLSSGPAQSQAPSGSPCFQDSPGAMSSDGTDPKSLNDLYKKVEELAGQVTSLLSTSTQPPQQVTLLSTAHSKLSTEQSALHREVTTLRNRNVQLTTVQAGLQREVMAMRANQAIIHRHLAMLTAEKDRVSAELEKLQKANHGDVVAKLSSVQADVTALQEDGASVKDVDQLKSDMAKIQGNLSNLESRFEQRAMHREVKDHNVQLTTEMASLQRRLAAMSVILNLVRLDLDKLMVEKDKMSAQLGKLQKVAGPLLSESNAIISLQQMDLDELKSDHDDVVAMLSSVQADITALQGDNKKMKEDIMAFQGDDNKMKEDITALQGDGASMKDVDRLKSDVANLVS